ncbi:hypothetical protein NKH45_23135 [Mesorhizobium sp. M1156]|uniref:hypothetical protein n=1 Tax=unclassified Mesorhizobium TaxID=325217 RepID=UPI00333720C6
MAGTQDETSCTLALTGAVIELLQGVRLIARDMNAFDWAADCAGMACGLAAMGGTRRPIGGLL